MPHISICIENNNRAELMPLCLDISAGCRQGAATSGPGLYLTVDSHMVLSYIKLTYISLLW